MTNLNKITSFLFAACLFCIHSGVMASVTITKAAGGTGISADKSANASSPAYTTLGDVVITEGVAGDFAIGTNVTFRLSCPAGWSFNTLASVDASASAGNDISAAAVTSVTSTLIIVQLTISGNTMIDVLTISGIEVQANEGGNVPGSGSITRGGTAVISGCVSGANLGSLSQSAGSVSKLVITLPGQVFSDTYLSATSGNAGSPINRIAGVSFIITKIRACDQFTNVVTSYFGTKTLTYSGPANGLTAPSYIRSVSFASGVSSTLLTTTLRKTESAVIAVTDGTLSGAANYAITVNPGSAANFLVESSSGGIIDTQVTGIPFAIRITARDANNNSCISGPNVFSGTTDITSTGTLISGSGTTAGFTGGMLSSHSVSISNHGNFVITANKTGGNQTGNSNTFTVNYSTSNLVGITPSCVNAGDSAFMLVVSGAGFTGASVVRLSGSARNTTYIDSTILIADVLSADIASPGSFPISVSTPGAGITAPLMLNTNSTSSANAVVCVGSSYQLPDGSFVSTAGTYISNIPNASGCDSTVVTNLSVNAIPARTQNVSICQGTVYTLPGGAPQNTPGTYVSNVPSNQGCDSVITTNLSFYSPPTLTATPVQINCFGNRGIVTLNASNGSSPYTFGPAATTNLLAGTYNYSVTDANGCITTASATINPAPAQLRLLASPTQIACFGETGSVFLSSSGGILPYTYTSTPTNNLTAGTYVYQVTDSNGCTSSNAAVISPAPLALIVATSATSTNCGTSNGMVISSASRGTPPYSYSWNTVPASYTSSVSGLPIGTYSVTVTDNNGCTVSKTATVTQSNPKLLIISGSTSICAGEPTTLCATENFASYSWSNGSTTSCILVATEDTFTVTVTDTSGCTATKSVVTKNSPLPSCTITGGMLCANGTLTLRAPAGSASYLWSNGIRTSTNSVRTAGTYSVTVRSIAGCTNNCSYAVNAPMKITVTKTDGRCSNEFKGSAAVTASSGIPPYSYLWSNGATTATTKGLEAGIYSIRVTDAGGCAANGTVTIFSNKSLIDYSSQAMTFNTTPIDSGAFIWFSTVANFTFTGNYPVTIRFFNQNISSSRFNKNIPNSKLIITNAVSQASTSFTNGEWVTTAPPDLSGNYFVSGYSYAVLSSIPASLSAVRWKGIWTSSSSCVTQIRWKWSAAAYSDFTADHAGIDVNPVSDATASPYGDNDSAGTPDNYKLYCIAGALSGGLPDYTGVYSSVVNRSPCSTPDSCNTAPSRLSAEIKSQEHSNIVLNAYPNPFQSITNIEFRRMDKSGHVKIDIFNMFGKKVRNIFDNNIEAGVTYSVSFDSGILPEGIYFCRMVTDHNETGVKLYLKR